jgi:hypothetical protein
MNPRTEAELRGLLWTLKSAYDFVKFMQRRRVSPEVEQFSAYMENRIGKALADIEVLIESSCHTENEEELPF